jgi:uncharacterized membrane protein
MENTGKGINTKDIIMTGLMMALVTIATMIFVIPVPFTNGYIHLGDSMIFLAVFILGYRYGAIAAGVGSALADIFVGYANWAPWTLCIKGTMALLMGLAIEKSINNKKNLIIISLITAGVWAAFNFIVTSVISVNLGSNPEQLYTEDINNLTSLGEFVNKVQSQLMLFALLIPVFLIIISIYFRKRDILIIKGYQIVAMTLSGLFMVFGYYIAGGIMYGNFAISAFSIPWNMIQFIIGFFIAMLVMAALQKTPAKKFFKY